MAANAQPPAGPGFLSFNSLPPRLHITADDPDFDTTTLSHFRAEGFDVTYLPLGSDIKAYKTQLSHLADDLELGEDYAIVAYGDAAAICLEHHIKPQPHLAALIAYYPTTLRKPTATYPTQLHVQCHLASTQGFAPAFPSYTYQGVKVGFAEHDLDTYDAVAASLAWTRTLGLLRKAFKLSPDLEGAYERHVAVKVGRKDAAATMATCTEDVFVENVPTMTGGSGQKDLFIFYRDYVFAKSPPSLRMKLVSRTLGVDRVVDELVVSFKHTHEVPWILPGVQPTGKVVHVAIVSVVSMRGGRVRSERVYWDQASVLVQVGLLDPGLVPEGFRGQGLKRLPCFGKEAASKVLDEESQPWNGLVQGWADRPKGDPGAQMPARPKEAANGGK